MWAMWVLFHNLLKFITKMSEAFPVEQFRDVFQATPKIKNKLQPFIAQYKVLNMDWIINSFEELHRYFFDEKTDVTLKFNSIFGIKFLFDTAEVVLVNLIEIYFLPKIFEIASFDARGNEEKRGTAYFTSVGYPKDTPQIQKLSYNFVRLASEFVQVAATVKSKRLYMNEEIDDPSEYFEACQRLQQQGWKPYGKPAYYKDAQAMPPLFKKNLKSFDQVADPYIDFYVEFFRLYLEKGKVYQGRLNPKRVLESGDVYITGQVIDQCVQFFKSESVRQRLQAVGLLSEFIRWGDIEAAYQINCTDLIDDILREVSNTNSGISNLSRGKSMFAKLESSEQLKQQLYVEVLKAIQFWSLCFPRALKVKNRDSKVKYAHDELRMKLKIEFPQDKNLKEHKMEFDRNIVRKRKRNNIILDELQNEDPEYVSIIPSKPKIESSNSIPPKSNTKIEAPTPESVPGDYGRIRNNIKQAKFCLSTLFENEAGLPQKIAKLNKFKQEFQSSVESADVNDDEFNELLEEGSPVLDRIDKVMPHLNNYTAKKISFKDLPEAINAQGKSRIKEALAESPVKKEVVQSVSSNVKIEAPKSEKKINHEETSLKVQEKLIKQEKTIPKVEKERQQTEKKVPKTMQQVERVSKDSIKMTEARSLKAAQEVKPRVQQSKAKLEKPREQKKVEAQTPIKQLRQKFEEEHSMSSLPQVSKQSLSKSLDEELNIEPASHQILAEKEVINLNLFRENNRTSLNQKEQQLGDFSRKLHNKAFDEEIEHDVEVNPPKVIHNVKGSYQLRGQAPLQQVADVVKDSRSRIDFEESKLSKVEIPEDDEDDLIAMPQINPLDVSYHDIGGIEDQLKENKELSFKKCFEAQKYLLGPNKNTKMFWLEKDTMSLIKPGGVRRNSRNKDSTISIPEILSEKDKKYQSEIKYIQEQNNRKIRDLEKKINNLQSEGKQLQIKIVEQDKQIKSYKAQSSVSNSRAKKNLYIQDQDQLFRTRHAQKSTKERSFYEEPRIKQSKCLQPQGKLISSRKYSQYFNAFSEQKKKKNLLKNKELLFKDDSIEFGCMSKREGDTLLVTFYITPESDLEGLTYNISPVANSNLSIAVQPRNVATIRRKKQEKVIVSVKVLAVPYSLPDIEFLYNLDGRMSSHRFTVPCAFHKFIHIDSVSEKDLAFRFQSSRNIIRGEQVPYSRKLLKNMESLCEYFPSGSLLRGGESNQNGEIEFGGKAAWQRESFWLKILIKPSQFLCVQAVGEDLSHAVQFYVSLITSLLMKNVELSELK